MAAGVRLGAVLFLALLTSQCKAHHEALGVPPIKYAGYYTCPRGYEYTAYGRVVYAPDFPSQPLPSAKHRPSRCFKSSREARLAGYRDAPLPKGDRKIGGIYLVRTGRSMHHYCERAAEHLGRAVPCPALLPASLTPAECDGPGCEAGGRFLVYGNFPAPAPYRGLPGGSGGHMNLWSGRAQLIRKGYFGCPWGKDLGNFKFEHHPAKWIQCPEGSTLDSGHLILQWSVQRDVVGVTFHGRAKVNRSLALTVARHLSFVRPS